MKTDNKCFKLIIIMLVMIVVFSIAVNASYKLINMNFRDADIRDVLRTIAELSNTNLVTDGSVAGEITVRLNNVSFQEALDLITSTYNLGYRWYENTVVVAIPERIDSIYADISIKNLKVHFADLKEIQELLSDIFPEVEILNDYRNNQLVLKGKKEELLAVENFLAKVDIEKAEISEIISVPNEKLDFLINYLERIYPELIIDRYGNSSIVFFGAADLIEKAKILVNNLSDKLIDIRTADKQIMESVFISYSDLNYIKEHITSLYPDIQATADIVNSQLILHGSISDISSAKEFIARLDLPPGKEVVTEIINIKNAELNIIETSLNNFIPDLEIRTNQAAGQIYLSGSQEDLELAISIANNIDLQAQEFTRIQRINYLSFADLDGIITELFSKINFSFNQNSREIIFTGREEYLDEFVRFIKEIDRPRKQVIIEARIEEMLTSDLLEIGVDPNQLSQIRFLDSSSDGFIDDVSLTLPEFLGFLDSNSISTTLANPSLMAISGEEARLLIGDRIPIPIKDSDGNIINIEYIDTGISLEFFPVVGDDNRITLEVKPMISTIGDSVGTSIPAINTREAETKVILDDGELMAIGGLIRDEERENLTQIPLLSSIPFIGELFRHRSSENRKTEVIIFIRPHIVHTDIENIENREENLNKAEELEKTSVKNGDNNASNFISLTREELLAIIGIDPEEGKEVENEK